MQQVILLLHVVIAFFLIVLVLVQHGKGADIGAAFGSGASQTIFGSQGSGSLLLKVTCGLAAVFFATSLTLTYLGAEQVKQNKQTNIPLPPTQITVPVGTTNPLQNKTMDNSTVPTDVMQPKPSAPPTSK